MQSMTRWCLNEGSMWRCTNDENGVLHMAYRPPVVSNRRVDLQVNAEIAQRRICAFACLKSTLSRIALSATNSGHERLAGPARIRWIILLRETLRLTCDLSPGSFRDITEGLTT
jgi:hypothetical protein